MASTEERLTERDPMDDTHARLAPNLVEARVTIDPCAVSFPTPTICTGTLPSLRIENR